MKYFLMIPVLLWCLLCEARQNPLIQFDGSGKLRTTLPQKLNKDEKIKFKVSEPKETFDTYLKKYTDRLKLAIGTLDKLKGDQEKMKILGAVFDINVSDIDGVIAEMTGAIGNPWSGAVRTYIPVFTNADKDYFNVVVENTALPANVNIAPNQTTNVCPVTPAEGETQINFTLTKTDPYKKMVYEWLQQTKGQYAGLHDIPALLRLKSDIKAKIDELKKFAEETRPQMQKMRTEIGSNQKKQDKIDLYTPFLNEVIRKSRNYLSELNTLLAKAQEVTKLHNKKNWMLKWLWYQSTLMPSINPLGFEKNIGPAPDTTRLASLQLKVQSREKFLAANIDKLKPNQLDSILDVIDTLKKDIFDIQRADKVYKEKEASNQKAMLSFGTTRQELNKGIFLVGDELKMMYWMRHHNAADNFQLMNDLDNEEYLEGDRVAILSHNLKPNEKTDLNITITAIDNDVSLFTELLQPVIKELAGALITTGAPAFTNLNSLINDAEDELQTLIAKIEELPPYLLYIDYLLTQTDPPFDIEEKTDKSSAWHSEIANPAKKVQGPKKVTYHMKTALVDKKSPDTALINKVAADTFTYRVKKLYRLFPMAGVTWTTTRFTNVVQDTANGNSPNKTEGDAPIKFVVGLKVYIRKTDIRSSKIFTKKDEHGRALWPSRLSFNLAFDAKKPLDNIYTGAGLDIWPGICFNLGVVLNKYSYKTYKNGDLLQEKNPYRAGFYLGLSTDLSLFTELGKFLNF